MMGVRGSLVVGNVPAKAILETSLLLIVLCFIGSQAEIQTNEINYTNDFSPLPHLAKPPTPSHLDGSLRLKR